MDRKPHLLKPNKTSQFPRHLLFFDTETLQSKISSEEIEHKFKLGVALYWRRDIVKSRESKVWLKFKDLDKFWDFVFNHSYNKTKLYLIAHNIQFDFKVTNGFEHFRKNGFYLKKLILNNFCNIWSFKNKNRSIICLDNMNYFNQSLRNLGESIGIEKLEMPEEKASEYLWFKYCKRDVEVMEKSWFEWLKFLKDNDLGVFAPTLAAQSFSAFRHRFMNHKIYIHTKEKAIELERESYHGGRTECFFIGKLDKSRFYCLDVNSMYPYMMTLYKYPSNLKSVINQISVKNLTPLLTKFCVIAKVEVETSEPVFSLLIDNKLCFPTGRFETVLTTREIKYAIKNGYLRKIKRAAIYSNNKLFTEYVKFFYQQRQIYEAENNPSFSFLCKLMLNSLYGKWGQLNEVWKFVKYDYKWGNSFSREWDIDNKKWYVWRVINGRIEELEGRKEAFNSFPAISAHITADARLFLWNYIKLAGGANVFYCDTDSLIVNQQGFDNLSSDIVTGELGKLKVEREANQIEIRDLKDYSFGSFSKIKGIKKNAVPIGKNMYSQWQFEGLKGALHHRRLDRQVMVRVTKTLKREYNKGRVMSNGKVKPFKLYEQTTSKKGI